MCGAHLSIVSPRPQTTRVQVRGIAVHGDDQLVLLDTPGYDRRAKALSRAMLQRVMDAMVGADLVMMVTDVFPALRKALERRGAGAAFPHDLDRRIVERMVDEGAPRAVLVINKVDTLPRRNLVLPVIEQYDRIGEFAAIVPVSARTGLNVEHLANVLSELLPEGEPLFPPDQLTDRPERFLVAETVRETAFHLLHEEVPYAVAVAIEHWIEEESRLVIDARILVEEESQKRIVVGKGGAMVKEIGVQARRRIQRLLDRRVHLGLVVGVRRRWSADADEVERLIESP
jgi:GTP-binding protein Era